MILESNIKGTALIFEGGGLTLDIAKKKVFLYTVLSYKPNLRYYPGRGRHR